MKVPVVTICNWLSELNLNWLNRPIKLWIDICQVPPKDGLFHIFYACEPTIIVPHVKQWIILNWQHFDLVLSHDKDILKNCLNSKILHWTNMWIK